MKLALHRTTGLAAIGLALLWVGSADATPIQLTLTATDQTTSTIYTTTYSDVILGGDTVSPGSSPNSIVIPAGTQGAIAFSGEQALSFVGMASNTLITSALSVTNTSATDTYSLTAVLSGMNFTGPANAVSVTGSGTWSATAGSVMKLAFYNDPTDTLGGSTATDTPGNLVGSFTSSPAVGLTSSYAYSPGTALLADPDFGDYSMTEAWSYTLPPDGALISRGQNETGADVPEPGTLFLLLTGLGVLGAGGRRAKRKPAS